MFACPYIKLLKLVCVLTCKDLRLARCACWQRGYTIGTVGKVTAVGLLVQCSYSVLKIINILFFTLVGAQGKPSTNQLVCVQCALVV